MRRRLAATDNPTYFITVVTHQRQRIFISSKTCDLFFDNLKVQRVRLGFRLYEYALMPDHYHLIIAPPKHATIGSTIRLINGTFARYWNLMAKRTGPVFQSRFYDHVIRNELDYLEKAKYIHDNPVRAGLSDDPETYPWSSAAFRYGMENDVPVMLDSFG